MGGSGGSLSSSLGSLNVLASEARETLRSTSEPERRNIFISFASEDLNEVNLLRGQARNELSELVFNDYSLREPFDSKNAEYIRSGIRERIRQSSVTVVYVSDVTHQSRWVDWEIRESLRLGKGVVAVHKGDTAPRQLPTAIGEHRIRVVRWQHAELMAAIDEAGRKR